MVPYIIQVWSCVVVMHVSALMFQLLRTAEFSPGLQKPLMLLCRLAVLVWHPANTSPIPQDPTICLPCAVQIGLHTLQTYAKQLVAKGANRASPGGHLRGINGINIFHIDHISLWIL